MKKTLLLLLAVFSAHLVTAQMADGTVLSNTITGEDVVTGETVDLFEWLEDDKTVIVDVFTTWCGPCWSFHQSGMLENLYDQYGPEGTDVLRIVGAEADATTTMADLMGTGSNTAGDWLDGVHYNIVDNASWASYFSVGYYPSIFVIRPNKGVFHMYGDEYRANINDPAWWDRAIGQGQADDMLASLKVPTGSKCDPQEQVQVDMFNFGTSNITTAEFDVEINGTSGDPMVFTGDLEPFRKQVYLSSPITIPEGETAMTVTSSTINGSEIAADDVVSDNGVMYYSPIEETSFFIKVHTDADPEQTSGKVYDHNGQTIKSFGPFEATDEYQTFEFHVTLPFPQDEIDCVKILIFDGNGDGMANWDGTSNVMPGIELADTQGNTIKPVIEPFEAWSINRIDNAVNAIASSNEDLSIVTGLSVSPNPASDQLLVDLDLASAEAIQLIMYNNMGQQVMIRNIQANQGFQQQRIDVTNFDNGMYTLQTVSESGIRSVKVVVSK